MSGTAASIDIGTNTILMLIGNYHNDKVVKIHEKYDVARLGEEVDKTGILKSEAIERTGAILKECRELCEKFNVEKIVAVGTSALRDASNSAQVRDLFNDILGSEIVLVTGLEEAALSFMGTVESKENSLVIDIGGGSTELICGEDQTIFEKQSLQAGAVRITERFFRGVHPPDENKINQALSFINELLDKYSVKTDFQKVYAVAGTATTLATTAMGLPDSDVAKINGLVLSRNDINRIYDIYLSASLSDIVNKLYVHPRRADLILAGSLIMKSISDYYNINEIIVSSKGLRYGILLDYFRNKQK
ncbi:MAG: hypothetical protein WCZ17_05465 [Candidatus Kapaibacterium sp.]